MEMLVEQVGGVGPLIISAVKALLVLVIGWIVAGFVAALIRRKMRANPNLDETLGNFAASIAKWVILLMVLVAVLNVFGIQATSLVAVLGAATLAIGMALQGTLSDLAAGFMLILFRPYKIGQYVDIGGTDGVVVEINLFVTELRTLDNVQVIIPNGQAWGSVITNFSHHETRRVDIDFGIDYGDDADTAMAIITDVASNNDLVLKDPEPWVRVVGLGDSSVDLQLRVWCAGQDFWEVKFGLTKSVKEAFDTKGISIPYPHTVEIRKDA